MIINWSTYFCFSFFSLIDKHGHPPSQVPEENILTGNKTDYLDKKIYMELTKPNFSLGVHRFSIALFGSKVVPVVPYNSSFTVYIHK